MTAQPIQPAQPNRSSIVEWVVGVSVPIGSTRDSPDIGVFAYMSIEYSFRKKNGE